MKASEILRHLADVVDAAEAGSQPSTLSNDNVEVQIINSKQDDEPNETVMIPPLQQKIELLKRSVGVDNEFDRGFDEDYQTELEDVKKNAGIPSAAITDELASDDPLEI
jgi:hypothetical protein